MLVGIAVDNTVPLHLPSFVNFVHNHSQTIQCRPLKAPLRFTNTKIDYVAEVAKLNGAIRKELEGNDLSLLLTALPFVNNYYYTGSDGIFIISFSDWHLLTTLPMSNGLAYMLCQIISKHQFRIGENHDDRTGCINDFWWDKRGIDVGMRAAFVCDHCKAHSTDNPYLASKEFTEIVSILNAISHASRTGSDILSEMHPGSAELELHAKTRSVFLCHNRQDKTIGASAE